MNENLVMPRHVAIILDGNGRWAKKRGLPRTAGHTAGAKTVEQICEDAYKMGIEYLTVYAFSTENWSRPQEEVSMLMDLLRNYLKNCIKTAMKNNMKVRIIGDKTRLDPDLQEKIQELEEKSSGNTGLKFQIALNYGGQDEIVRAVKKLATRVESGEIKAEDITKDMIEDNLDTAGIPAPDLLIRTSREVRISNFLLWQLAYSEMYFPDVLWPDFSKKNLEEAVEYYNSRDRRYGGIKA